VLNHISFGQKQICSFGVTRAKVYPCPYQYTEFPRHLSDEPE